MEGVCTSAALGKISSGRGDATLVGTGIINNNVQIIREKIRTLEAVSEGKIPLETFGGSIGLASGCGGFPCACPVEIRLNIVEGAELDIRSRDDRLAAV